jgi:hypothetical protein
MERDAAQHRSVHLVRQKDYPLGRVRGAGQPNGIRDALAHEHAERNLRNREVAVPVAVRSECAREHAD